jgi:hypothetical protein
MGVVGEIEDYYGLEYMPDYSEGIRASPLITRAELLSVVLNIFQSC